MAMSAEQKAVWLSARAGLLTASRMNEAMGKKGPKARAKLMLDLLSERTGTENVRHAVNDAMLHGLEYEDEAADVFVGRFPKYNVQLSRFYLHPQIEFFGATPDRECGEDGLLEIKCPATTTFVGWVLDGIVPEEHKPQMCAQILCSGKKWCGFLAYNPRIRDESRRLFMRKYVPTQDELVNVETAAVEFLNELDNLFDRFVNTPA